MTTPRPGQPIDPTPKLSQELQAFKLSYPDVAKALELFQLSMEEYRQALVARGEPLTFNASSTEEAARAR